MEKLLIVADDFTGALDTGVQFAARGAKTCVVTDPAYRFSRADPAVQVLVLDAETRHLTPGQAYDVVFLAVRGALAAGFTHIYKKTDSALRGNVGAELTAAMDAAGADRLAFLPAMPKTNRVTRGGIHYIDGVPAAESVFGRDPFEPVTASYLPELLGAQSPKPVVLHPLGEGEAETAADAPGIQVYDAETDEDLRAAGARLGREALRLCAGCAGFASVLADLLGIRGTPPAMPLLPAALFVICGSVNPVTLRQMDEAERRGFPRVRLGPVQKLDPLWLDTEDCAGTVRDWLETAARERRFILDVNDPPGRDDTARYAGIHGMTTEDLRSGISAQLGQLSRRVLDGGLDATLLCTGGDTLLALTRAAGAAELTPVCEMDTGAVLTHCTYRGKTRYIISKSGGFGQAGLFLRLAQSLGVGIQKEDAVC